MSELTPGQLADEKGYTFEAFEARCKRAGRYEGIDAMRDFISEELDKETRIAEQMKMAGMTGKVGAEA